MTMRKLLMLGLAISVILSSCVKNTSKDEIATPKTTEVGISIKTNSLENQSSVNRASSRINAVELGYKRNYAPVYVSGVELTAKYLDLSSVADVSKQFLFVDGNTGGADIKMSVPLGRNRFIAVSVNKYLPKVGTYEDAIEKQVIERTDADKLEYYSAELIKLQPIYAVFNGELEHVVTETGNSINIPMVTKTARYGVVLESSENYDITMSATLGSTSRVVEKKIGSKASAIVFNDANVFNGHTLSVTLAIRADGKEEIIKNVTVGTYTAESSKNKTLVISYNKSGEILLQETNVVFTWTPMVNEGEIKNID